MLKFLDIFFFVFHSLFILFNLLGWIWPKTRKINLATLMLTAFSWTVLGIWKGFGYCPCTHWHWEVRFKLGDYSLPESYIKFLLDSIFGWDLNATLVDVLTGVLFITALGLSVYVNFFSKSTKKEIIHRSVSLSADQKSGSAD